MTVRGIPRKWVRKGGLAETAKMVQSPGGEGGRSVKNQNRTGQYRAGEKRQRRLPESRGVEVLDFIGAASLLIRRCISM